jgi:TnpA family transposase
MAAIERTAYPRFTPSLTATELQRLYAPTEEDRTFVTTYARGPAQRLTLLVLLKCHQHLGYLPALADVPDQIRCYLCQQLHLPPTTYTVVEATRTLARYRYLIRTYLAITPYTNGGVRVVIDAVHQAASTMSDPADLINVAIEHLIQQRFELPAFSTLDRLVGHIRHRVHQTLYAQITGSLNPTQQARLDALLEVTDGPSEFGRMKASPRQATLTHLREWLDRLTWLEAILAPQPWLAGMAHTKIRQFAAEAGALEVGDMRDIHPPRRWSLLLCFLAQTQVQTRDQLVEMFLKRMQRMTTAAHEHLHELQDQHRELEEQMLAVFAEVLDEALHTPEDDPALGEGVRHILATHGGAATLRAHYEHVSAYHHDNYRPLLWRFFRSYRAALFRLSHLLGFRCATHDQSLIAALQYIQRSQHTTRALLPAEIALDFASVRWQALIKTRHKLTLMLHRHLEVCVFHYLDHGLRSGDVYVDGSEAYADYRQQLLPWAACVPRLPAYCQAVQLPATAAAFVTQLQARLREVAQQVDRAYPTQTTLTIDAEGVPHLKRLKARPVPAELATVEALLKARMPERHLLDVLRDVHYWAGYTRHFGPPSGADPQLTDAVLRYIFTVFGYTCELEAALGDVIREYVRFELPFLWGSGQAAIADGTHIALLENNLLGAQHVRYGRFGGIAYHHISDTYIALFSHFIACGVWEAVYILDGLLKNRSALQPTIVHADTHGQAEPVFGLAALLGIDLLPRMRTWQDVTFYRADAQTTYQHIDALFTQVVDWDLIARHWQDMMQVVLSIQAGHVVPSMLLRKLGVYSRHSALYKAFSELGLVERTIFLLTYMTDPALQQHIRAETTKVEAYHHFTDWLAFGSPVLRSGDPVEQEKRIKYRDWWPMR